MTLRLVWLTSSLSLLALIPARAQITDPSVTQAFGNLTLSAGQTATTIDLTTHFGIPDVTGQVAQIDTLSGKINIELLANDAPLTVANFLNYINAGRFTNTIIHRSVPNFVIQGGGYLSSLPITHITTFPAVQNEFKISNTRGTVAMAKLDGQPNSATSEWFINLNNNSANLDAQNGGFTVFARVMSGGMAVADTIAGLPRSADEFPLFNYVSGAIGAQHLLTVRSVGIIPISPTTPGETAVITYSVTNTAPAVATVSVSASTLSITPLTEGTATITVRATDTNSHQAQASFLLTVEPGIPTFLMQPLSATVATGSTTALTVVTDTPSAALQWKKDGTPITGATSSTLLLSNVQAGDAGDYTVDATTAAGTATSDAATIQVSTPATRSVLVNLSIRTNGGTGNQVISAGFVIGGTGTTGTKPLLIRAAGPALIPLGITSGTMVDPRLDVIPLNASTAVAVNDNWAGDAAVTSEGARLGAFVFKAPGSDDPAVNSTDAALVTSLNPGPYTAVVSGANNGTGIVLAEIYDASETFDAATPRLVNVSARAQVNTGNNVLVAGFVISGTTARTVLIRAVGPRLNTLFGLTGVLLDPTLVVHRNVAGTFTPVARNDNWGGDASITSIAATVGAFSYNDPASSDSAVLITLPPGVYTATASGVNNTVGIALVEVYEVE